jgi:hypothetical protein
MLSPGEAIMSASSDVYALVEGRTEQLFIERILAPYLGSKNISLRATQLSKPGQKGGDVKFVRAKKDIGAFLKQRSDTWVTLLVDYYGIDANRPGYAQGKDYHDHTKKFQVMRQKTKQEVDKLFAAEDSARRFIPYVSMHEFEALLFSDSNILAEALHVQQKEIDAILAKCVEPEAINDSRITAPSKRLESLFPGFKEEKTRTGIDIAQKIGIDVMRSACPLFNTWINQLESLTKG